MATRIVLADDHRIMLEGLRILIGRDPGLQVVGQAGNGRDAVNLARRLRPDLVIMDVSLPELNGIEATRQVTAENPECKVIALSIHADTRYVLEMLKAGASGYLLKQCAFEELSRAIREVMANRAYLGPDVTHSLLKDYVQYFSRDEASAYTTLSPREREVLQLLAEGRSTREVAERLNLSVKTVETHRQNLMRKLGFQSTAQLVKYAIREGITSL